MKICHNSNSLKIIYFFNFFLVQISLNITLKEGDTIFQRPLTRTQPILLPGEEEKRRNSTLPDPNRTNLMIPPGGTVCSYPVEGGGGKVCFYTPSLFDRELS